jgi:hypothetical protein
VYKTERLQFSELLEIPKLYLTNISVAIHLGRKILVIIAFAKQKNSVAPSLALQQMEKISVAT